MQITDRAKDVIKSGGEWISSIDLENLAVGHPDVAEAAVIGVAHPKWDERPLLIVVAKEGKHPNTAEVLGFLEGRIAKWWMPDDMQFVDGNPPHRHRQDQQAEAARSVQGLQAADLLNCGAFGARGAPPHCARRTRRGKLAVDRRKRTGSPAHGERHLLAADFLLDRGDRRPCGRRPDAAPASFRLRHGARELQPWAGLPLRHGHGRVVDVRLDSAAAVGRPAADRTDGRTAADGRSGDRRACAQ